MKKIWVYNTTKQSNGATLLNNIQQRLKIINMRRNITKMLYNIIGETNNDNTNKIIERNIDEMIKGSGFGSSKTECRKETWKICYPDILDRCRSFIVYQLHKIFKFPLNSREMKWYHLLFGYKIIRYKLSTDTLKYEWYIIHNDDEFDFEKSDQFFTTNPPDLTNEEDVQSILDITHKCSYDEYVLKIPDATVTLVDTYINVTNPIEIININFEIK